MYSASDGADVDHLYRVQLTKTTARAHEVHAELDRLSASISDAVGIAKEAAEHQKVMFLTVMLKTSLRLFEQLQVQEATFHASRFLCRPSDEERANQRQFYHAATGLLEAMERVFNGVLGLSLDAYAQILEDFSAVFKANVARWASTGAILGGAIGSGVHGLVWPHGIFHFGLHAPLVAKFGAEGGAVCAGIVGGAGVGFLLVCILAAGFAILKYICTDAAVSPPEEFEMMYQKLKKDNMTAESIFELTELFEKFFVKPVQMALEGDTCAICLNHFPVDGHLRLRAIRTAGCTCRSSWFHEDCLKKWRSHRADPTCPVCRQ